ncbi:MAG: hypothetical protein JWN62_1816 [Acidimicrobiales bacterium]|nr:hypothetical protein [Acidimicrobiales bacterium]
MSSLSVTDDVVSYDTPEGGKAARRRRAMYATFITVVSAVVGASAVEAATSLRLFGIDTESAHATANGVQLDVDFPRVTRPQINTPMHITVHRPGGFADAVTVEVSSSYLALYVTDDITPQPSSETTDGEMSSMTFDPPVGDTLEIDLDVAAKPRGWFADNVGTVAVMNQNGDPDVSVNIDTGVRP